jgi:hypothetical protein
MDHLGLVYGFRLCSAGSKGDGAGDDQDPSRGQRRWVFASKVKQSRGICRFDRDWSYA